MSEAAAPEGVSGSRRTLGELLRPRPVALTLAVLAFVLVGGLGAVAARDRDVQYGSNTVLVIDEPLLIAQSRDAGPIEKLGRLRLQYAALVKTAAIADDIAARTGRSAGDVASHVDVLPSQNSLLVVVTARDRQRSRAVQLASATADALIRYTTESQAKAQVPAAQRVTFSVVTPARTTYAILQGKRYVATVAGCLGLVAAAAVYVVVSLSSALRRR